MRCPPPTEKGVVNIEYIVESLPDRGRSCWHLGAVWALSQFQENEVSEIFLSSIMFAFLLPYLYPCTHNIF